MLFQLTVIAVLVTNPIAGYNAMSADQIGYYLIGASCCLLIGIFLITYSKKLKRKDEERANGRTMDVTVKKGVFHVMSAKSQNQ